jgi:heme-degrading monooxygenase HmoA
MEDSFRAAMREMRWEAVYAPGYIGGETLRDVAAPGHYVVISTWRSQADWDAWAVSAARDTVRDRGNEWAHNRMSSPPGRSARHLR